MQFFTELCRNLAVLVSYNLTKAEREVRTGDSSSDISSEVRRILNEFGTSFDDAIDSDVIIKSSLLPIKASTKTLASLGIAWLLRSKLMLVNHLVEKDVSARGFGPNAPRSIEE